MEERIERTMAKDCVDKAGQTVRVAGWASTVRDHGGLIFIDLRDWSGTIQLVIDVENKGQFQIAEKIGTEYVIEAEGKIRKRADDLINSKIPTGEIEIEVDKIEILNKSKPMPFPIDGDGRDIDEQMRLKYRFIDLRRDRVKNLMKKRHELILYTRNWFSEHEFLEVQTPLLTVSSPEGARDFLVPSRIYPGKFYALPQAPQQYKQLLMVGGVHKYFQIAPCFRDEDPRADRHSGAFYQIDVECSFVNRDEFFALVEPYFKEVIEDITDKKLWKYPLPRIAYKDSIDFYGNDKPDLRFEMKLTDLTEQFHKSDMKIFQEVETVKAVLVDKDFSRKELDDLTDEVKLQGAGGLAWFKVENGEFGGQLVKFFEKDLQKQMLEKFTQNGYEVKGAQTILAIADDYKKACSYAGWVRSKVGDILGLKDPDTLAFAWIVDFPMYEWDERRDKWDFGHNPFSMVKGGLEALRSQEPEDILSEQYDIVCNGYEISSGSIRNHDPEVLVEAFKVLGYSEERTRREFAHMISAFEFGAPPHGGFAPGIDRMMMIFFDEDNIREIYAFPKSNASEPMTGAPREVPKEDLDVLHIDIKKSSKKKTAKKSSKS
ncbi:aspartate--tRNA ligase [Candidatus Dojkabacteria bacterium]|nr:aspartate--tRNA ligase [Candidatus Dojkabacteria bacterium]